MEIIVVKGKKEKIAFYQVARQIYNGDPNWICPPDLMVESRFDPKRNTYFHDGEFQRWYLKDRNGRLCGRIAAFYNREKAAKYDIPVGGTGFFECIENQDAAFLLFDSAKEWLSAKGMMAMDGPVNPGENDFFWGLLVEGFSPPAFGMNYNPSYYRTFFENYGFQPFFEQESMHLDLSIPFPERFWRIAERVLNKPGYTFLHYSKKQPEKFARDLVSIHNQAWVYHEHFTPLKVEGVVRSFVENNPFIVEDFIWFVYHNGEPVAFLIMLPDMNRVFRLFRGKLNVLNKIRLLALKSSTVVNRGRITIMGVIPKYQGTGIESALFWHLKEPVLTKRPHYKELEISWVGDFNPKMKAIVDAMGAFPGKKHITYRKLFNDRIPFRRAAPIITDGKDKGTGL